MKTVKVDFKYFWRPFNLEIFKRRFPHLLPHYNFVLSASPDFLFFSSYTKPGNVIPVVRKDCVRIFISGGEPIEVDMSRCDYAFTYKFIEHDKHCRLPFYVHMLYGIDYSPKDLLKPQNTVEKVKFCNYVYSHITPYRDRFVKKLCRYKKVDSAGKCLNNMRRLQPGWIKKLQFLQNYKFTIAFDNEFNTELEGLSGEKIAHPMLVGSIPLFFGNPRIGEDFNSKSFLNLRDFRNEEEFIERIIEVDNDDSLYRSVLEEPWYKENKIPDHANEEKILSQFRRIFDD